MRKIAVLIALAFSVMLYACGGPNTNYNLGAQSASGTSQMILNGGDSTSGAGGYSGLFEIDSYGPITVSKGGTVDASFTMPTLPAAKYGTNKVEITSNTTVQLDQNDTAGGLFMNSADSSDQIYVGDGAAWRPWQTAWL